MATHIIETSAEPADFRRTSCPSDVYRGVLTLPWQQRLGARRIGHVICSYQENASNRSVWQWLIPLFLLRRHSQPRGVGSYLGCICIGCNFCKSFHQNGTSAWISLGSFVLQMSWVHDYRHLSRPDPISQCMLDKATMCFTWDELTECLLRLQELWLQLQISSVDLPK